MICIQTENLFDKTTTEQNQNKCIAGWNIPKAVRQFQVKSVTCLLTGGNPEDDTTYQAKPDQSGCSCVTDPCDLPE